MKNAAVYICFCSCVTVNSIRCRASFDLLLDVVFYKTVSIVVSTGDFGFILSSVVALGSGHNLHVRGFGLVKIDWLSSAAV